MDVIHVKYDKPADKIEQKFKVGDWVVVNDGRIGRIIECTKDFADVDLEFSRLSTRVNNIRSWTIQDAKDGDVLATLDYILVFKEFLKNDGGISYCHYDFGAGNPQFIWSEDKNWYFGKEAIVHPATKEQRDLLFQKMKEAGYEWDAEKKELRKIERKLVFSKEDETKIKNIISFLEEPALCFMECNRDIVQENVDWLKSLRHRNK